MKITKKIRTLLVFLPLLIAFNTYSMETSTSTQLMLSDYIAYIAEILLGNIKFQPTESSPLEQLPLETQSKIISLLLINNSSDSLDLCGKTINALAQVNKDLHDLINDPTFSLLLIKHLAQQFECSDQEVAEALQTQEAKRQLDLQKQLSRCRFQQPNSAMSTIQDLIQQGIDFSFTYTLEGSQPLMPLMSFIMKPKVLEMVIQYADINQQNIYGNTLLLLILQRINPPLIPTIIERIFNLGADPEIANNKGLTPLQVAKNLGYNEAAEIIQNAIEKKYSKKEGK